MYARGIYPPTLKAVVYAGLFDTGRVTLKPFCESGNCTWSPYQSLALCSRCVDVTDLAWNEQSKGQSLDCDLVSNKTSCLWSLPNGLTLRSPWQTAEGVHTTFVNASGTLPLMALEGVGCSILNFSILMLLPTETRPRATECSLHWCINTYMAVVKNTMFTEHLNSTWYDPVGRPPVVQFRDFVDPFSGYNMTPPTGTPVFQKNIDWSDNWLSEFGRNAYIVRDEPEFAPWLGPWLSGNATITGN